MRRVRVAVDAREGESLLILILAALVGVADGADAIRLQKQHLCDAFVGVDARGQWGGVGDFDCHLPAPLGLEGRDIDNDAAAGVGALSHAHCEHITRHGEDLNGLCERE